MWRQIIIFCGIVVATALVAFSLAGWLPIERASDVHRNVVLSLGAGAITAGVLYVLAMKYLI
jgi:hypothetical protein